MSEETGCDLANSKSAILTDDVVRSPSSGFEWNRILIFKYFQFLIAQRQPFLDIIPPVKGKVLGAMVYYPVKLSKLLPSSACDRDRSIVIPSEIVI